MVRGTHIAVFKSIIGKTIEQFRVEQFIWDLNV